MNNYEQMREACANIAEYAKSAQCHTEDAHVLGYLRQMENWAQAALALPPRQCDVGTAEERADRQSRFCVAHGSRQLIHEAAVVLWNAYPYVARTLPQDDFKLEGEVANG